MATLAHIIDAMMVSDSPADIKGADAASGVTNW